MRFKYNDGGRKVAGFKGLAGDCVCRAIAIAANKDYLETYEELSRINYLQGGAYSARNGVRVQEQNFKDYMCGLGFRWVACMSRGSGCKVHLKASELPMGRIVCRVSRHMVAVIDGVINDTHDCSRGGTRCVYGYWRLG